MKKIWREKLPSILSFLLLLLIFYGFLHHQHLDHTDPDETSLPPAGTGGRLVISDEDAPERRETARPEESAENICSAGCPAWGLKLPNFRV